MRLGKDISPLGEPEGAKPTSDGIECPAVRRSAER